MRRPFIIRNRSDFPTDEVKALIRFACERVDMRGVCVNMKNARRHRWSGHAYENVPIVSNAPKSALHLVTINVDPDMRFPHRHRRSSRTPEIIYQTWQELVVGIAAHEAKHIEQFKEGLPLSEVRCEHFEAHMVKQYREKNGSV